MSMTIQGADRSVPQLPTSPAASPATAAEGARDVVKAQAARAAAAEEQQKTRAVDPQQHRQELEEAVDRLNEEMRKQGRNLAFSVDEQLNRTVITVKNSHSGEVVRQIPDETMLRVAHSIEEFKGLFHNEQT